MAECFYPNCKCIVGTSTAHPIPKCPQGLSQEYMGYHVNKIGNGFHVWGTAEGQWYWWPREKGQDPQTKAHGHFNTARAAYEDAMKRSEQ